MFDTVICWVPTAGSLGEATLADVLLCLRDADVGCADQGDSLLRRFPGAAVVLLVPEEAPFPCGCVGWPVELNAVASLLHALFSVGVGFPPSRVVRLSCSTHRESVELDLVTAARRGDRQGIEARPHTGRT